jgi:hypothetical protein
VWFDPSERLLVIAQALRPCASPAAAAADTWRYTVEDFYGFLGEAPFEIRFERSNYSGFRSLLCMPLSVTTRASAPVHLGTKWLRLNRTYNGRIAPRAALYIDLPVPDLATVVWRDNANLTFASDVAAMSLPPLRKLRQASSSEPVRFGDWDRFSVKVAMNDGRHGLATVQIIQSSLRTGYQVTAELFSFTIGSIQRETLTLQTSVPDAPFYGVSLFGNRAGETQQELLQLTTQFRLNETAISPRIGPQWTISVRIMVRPLIWYSMPGSHSDRTEICPL